MSTSAAVTAEEHIWLRLRWTLTGQVTESTPAILRARSSKESNSKSLNDAFEAVCKSKRELDDLDEHMQSNDINNTEQWSFHQVNFVTALAELYVAIKLLIAAQRKHGVDQKTIGLTERWLAAVGEASDDAHDYLRELRRLQNYEAAVPKTQGWIGSWPLGEGGWGTVYLYKKLDEAGNVVNRLVIKDCDHDKDARGREVWNDDEHFWTTNDEDERMPVEVKAMVDLQGRQGSEYIVKILNWRIASERRLYRLYLEILTFVQYCPLGDLHTLMFNYVENAQQRPEGGNDGEDEDEDEENQIPEPFLWHVFECLCIVGLLLERGSVKQNLLVEWRTIIHRDLKLGNVFLSARDRHRYCGYPTPKLGDFGLAIYEPDEANYSSRHTPGCCPVEQLSSVMEKIKKTDKKAEHEDMPWLVSTKTNVWGTAFVVAALMQLRSSMEELQYLDGLREPTFVEKMTPHPQQPQTLRQILTECMRFDPAERPSFKQVLKVIQANRDWGQQGLRDDTDLKGEPWETYAIHSSSVNEKFMNDPPIPRLGEDVDSDASTVGGEPGTELVKDGVKVKVGRPTSIIRIKRPRSQQPEQTQQQAQQQAEQQAQTTNVAHQTTEVPPQAQAEVHPRSRRQRRPVTPTLATNRPRRQPHPRVPGLAAGVSAAGTNHPNTGTTGGGVKKRRPKRK